MLSQKLNEKIEAIENDLENGSTTIAKNAIDVFAFAVDQYPENPGKIKEAANKIKKAKPSMAALQNMIDRCLVNISDMEAPFSFKNSAYQLKKDMDKETGVIIKKAVSLLSEKDQPLGIVTASYSSTVIKLFKELNNKETSIKIYALESVWQKRDYAEAVIKECSKEHISSQHLKMDDLESIIERLDAAIIGADSFHEKGSAVNGIPSYDLSKKCSDKIEFYVLAESYKKSNEAKIEDGFELIPEEYITKIITVK